MFNMAIFELDFCVVTAFSGGDERCRKGKLKRYKLSTTTTIVKVINLKKERLLIPLTSACKTNGDQE